MSIKPFDHLYDTPVWEDPPASRRGPRNMVSEAVVRMKTLVDHPVRWAKLAEFPSRSGASGLMRSIKQVLGEDVSQWEMYSSSTPDEDSKDGRRSTLYVRYLGTVVTRMPTIDLTAEAPAEKEQPPAQDTSQTEASLRNSDDRAWGNPMLRLCSEQTCLHTLRRHDEDGCTIEVCDCVIPLAELLTAKEPSRV